jgi:phosphatidylglycerophosphate synthase
MRKIPHQYENPIDNIILHIADIVQPFFYKLGFGPNTLTTISLVFWICGLYFFIIDKKHYTYYVILFMFLSYCFDCFDGHFARSYNMVTVFGDYYDHLSDFVKIILLIYIVYVKYESKFVVVFVFMLFWLVLLFIHLGCQELYYGNPSDTMYLLKYICFFNINNVTKYMNITRYVGCGTWQLILFLCVIYLKNSK